IAQDMMDSVAQAGGMPMVLPIISEEADADAILDRMDGLLVSGGPDVDPLLYNEQPHQQLGYVTPDRDVSELLLIGRALERDIPLLAICRGAQMLNVAAGGSLY